MDRFQKEQLVTQLKSEFKQAEIVIITRQSGLNAAETYQLRRTVRQFNAHFKIVKNSLARLALADTSFCNVVEHLEGPVGIVYAESVLDAAKAIVKFSKTNEKIAIVIGAMGNDLLSQAQINALAELPDLPTLRSQLVAVIQTPATRISAVLQAPAAQIARVVGAYSQKS